MLAIFKWDGSAMRPIPRFERSCAEEFEEEKLYRMEAVEERSSQSHSHYFASLTDAWLNLPEAIAVHFPTVEHLRKFALIKTGYCNHSSIVTESNWAASKLGKFLRPLDEFSIVSVDGVVVSMFRAKSQSRKSMKKDEFQKSKTDVLNYVASLVNVDPSELGQQ